MSGYVQTIKIAMIFFPLIAFIISAPFIVIQYHKYGSISFFKGLIIYSFVLYFMCAYFLIILPLPKISTVSLLTTPRMQLIPFKFIVDFVTHTSFDIVNIHTYITAFKESYFYVPLYNILLTLPFGIYLRYYFNCNKKKIILYTFLLSLFFELTQLSGLYFIYPRGYRLFDVDDLLLNTTGGLLGYFISISLVKILPKIEKVEKKAKERGKTISGLRRTTMVCLDLFIFTILGIFPSIFIKNSFMVGYIILAFIYYFIIPIFLKGSTLGEKFLNIKVVDEEENVNMIRLFYRNFLFVVIYIGIPFIISNGIQYLSISGNMKMLLKYSFMFLVLILYLITGIKYLFTNKKMIYEKLSKTKLISTIE